MSSSCLFSRLANTDLIEIYEYIAKENPSAAVQLISEIETTCDTLSKNPGIGMDRSHFSPNLLGFPLKSYIIFYREADAGIEIARILHGARDLNKIFESGT